MEKLLGGIRRAVDDYGMISNNETVAVGVSGGKDSMLLLAALNRLSRFHPANFTVKGIMLSLGTPGADPSEVLAFAKDEGIDLRVVDTQIHDIIFNVRKESNPCSLCAKMRRGALHDAALAENIRKIALGHHGDDAVETFVMNLFFEGRIGCYSPVTYLDRKDVTVIRPMIYLSERDIRNAVTRLGIPVMHNPCPADGHTERTGIKELVASLEKDYPGLKQRLYGALQRSEIDGWKEFPKGRKVPEQKD